MSSNEYRRGNKLEGTKNKTKKNKTNKLVIFILQILVFVLLIGGAFFATYYMFVGNNSNTYERNIKQLVTKINTVNDSVGTYNKGQALDPEKLKKARENMPQYIKDLSGIKDKLQVIATTEEYKKDQDNLAGGLEKNILIYRQIEAIIRDPEGKDIADAADNLEKYKEECIDFYSQISTKSMQTSLSSDCVLFIDNTLKYAREIAALGKEKEIKLSQNSEFVESIDSLVSRFLPINIDFSVQLTKERKEGGNLDNVINLARKNNNELDYIKQEYSNLAVPENAVPCYNAFGKILNSYEAYIESFTYSVQNEKLLATDASTEARNGLYTASNSKFKSVSKNYSDFLKVYTEFKNSNLK